MTLEQEIKILKKDYGLDDKNDEAFFKPSKEISNKVKNEVKEKYKVYLKNIGSKIRVGGSDHDSRIRAIIELVGLHDEEEEILPNYNDYDDDESDEQLAKFRALQSENKMKEIVENSRKQQKEELERQRQLLHPQPHPQENNNNENGNDDIANKNHNRNGNNRGNNNNNNNRIMNNNNRNGSNNNRNGNNKHFQQKRTTSGPQQQNTPHNPPRYKSSDNSQPERQRGPTPNYANNHKNYLNKNNHNEKNTNDQNEEINPQTNQNENVNENLENTQSRGGRGRGGRGRGGRGRGGRGRGGRGRGRGGRGRGRAPLGPMRSVIDEKNNNNGIDNINQVEQNNSENAPSAENQQYRQQNRNNRRNYERNQNKNQQNQRHRGGYSNRQNQRQNREQDNQNPQQSYPTADEIVIKEETQKITPQLRHILMLMDNQVTPETTEQEIRVTEWYHLEKLLNPINEENLQPGSLMNAPYLLVEFLIESFANDQPDQFRHIEHKNFENKQLMHLDMPFPMPMTFQSELDKIQVGFFNSSDFSTDQMNDLCSTVLTTLSQRSMLVIKIQDVDNQGFSFTELEDLSKELDFVYLYSNPEENTEMETISFTLKIMQYNWSNEKETRIIESINKMFNNSSIFECRKCGCTYSTSDGSKCYKTVHRGRRIPFEETNEMEIYDQDDQGQPVLLYNYTCCGEVEADAPGCEATNIENGNHEPYEGTSSSISIETLPIYS